MKSPGPTGWRFLRRLDLGPSQLKGVVDGGVHFWNRHVRDTVVILEEVNSPHPWYPMCDILLLWIALNGTQ